MTITLYRILFRESGKYYCRPELVQTQEEAEALFVGTAPDFVLIFDPITVDIPS